MSIVASQAASAIQNALLYRAGEERRKELAEAHGHLKHLNETLEERVRTRTGNWSKPIETLRETQSQLARSSTMASLGTLAAGIAHELNTPMGAIHSNADVERRAVRIIRGILRDPSVALKLGPAAPVGTHAEDL